MGMHSFPFFEKTKAASHNLRAKPMKAPRFVIAAEGDHFARLFSVVSISSSFVVILVAAGTSR